MALETFPYDAADYLKDAGAIAGYLGVILQDDEAPYLARSLGTVSRARVGFAQLSRDTGIAADFLERAASAQDPMPREIVGQLTQAFQTLTVPAKVA